MLLLFFKLFLVPLLLLLWGVLLALSVLSVDSLLFALPFLGLVGLLALGGWFVAGPYAVLVLVGSLLLARMFCRWPAWFRYRVPGSGRARWCRCAFRSPGEYRGATFSVSLPLALLSGVVLLAEVARRYDRSRKLPPRENLREGMRAIREAGRGTAIEVNDDEAEIRIVLE